MYCNQCGNQMKDSANFCKRCGAPADRTEGDVSESRQQILRFVYAHKKRILLITVAVLALCGGIVFGVMTMQKSSKEPIQKKAPAVVKTVKDVDLQEQYAIEDGRLVLDPLHVTYKDGTIEELLSYDVYIDTLKGVINDGAIEAKDLYDGKHLFRIEWTKEGQKYEFEKSVNTEHKRDTWGKYPDLVGKTGKEIASAYGELGAPEFGSLGSEDWGIAYVEVPSLGLRVSFAAGLLNKPESYGDSEAICIEMNGTLNTLFYNMEPEMSREDLESLLEISLKETEAGGCAGTLSDGKLIYIGAGQVQDGLYTPDTTVQVTVSEDQKAGFLEKIFQ